MEATTQLSDVLKLGKRLVTELDADESRDTLSHWMAHHIAYLIQRLEAQGSGDRLELEAECRHAIMELWAHRNSFRSSSRPFAKFEGLLSTLEALDPNSTSSFYFRDLDNLVRQTDDVDEQPEQWLNLARSIDRGARTLIGYCLSRAVADSTAQAAEWVELARNIESTLDADIKLVRIVVQSASVLRDVLPSDERLVMRELLQRRVESIDKLADASANLRSHMLDRIAEIDADQATGLVAPDPKDDISRS